MTSNSFLELLKKLTSVSLFDKLIREAIKSLKKCMLSAYQKTRIFCQI